MDSATTSTISSVLLWSFLPSFLTTSILTAVHVMMRVTTGRVPPKRQTRPYVMQWNLVYAALLSLYFLYTLYDPLYNQVQNGPMLDVFGLTPLNFSTQALKSSFRKQSLIYHPDKPDSDEEIFLRIRSTYEMLNDPVKRGAYAIFGPESIAGCSTLLTDITQQQPANDNLQCRTMNDYYWPSALKAIGYYFGMVAVFYMIQTLSGMLNKPNSSILTGARTFRVGLPVQTLRILVILLGLVLEWDAIHSGMYQLSYVVNRTHQENAVGTLAFPVLSSTLFKCQWLLGILSFNGKWQQLTIAQQIQVMRMWMVSLLMFISQVMPAIGSLLALALQPEAQTGGEQELSQYIKDTTSIQSLLWHEIEIADKLIKEPFKDNMEELKTMADQILIEDALSQNEEYKTAKEEAKKQI